MKKIALWNLILFFVWPLRLFAAYEVDIQLPKSQYVIAVSAEEQGLAQQRLTNLSDDEMKSFLSTRTEFLRSAAIALQKLKWGFGVGAIVKNKISFYREKREIKKYQAFAETLDGDERERLISSILVQEEEMLSRIEAYRSLGMKKKADAVIFNILSGLDRKLWEGAPIVSRANEFGFMAALGPQFEMGASDGKKIGGLVDVGLSLGYNRDQKALVFQIFRDKEKFISTQMPAIFIAGVVVKAGIMVANQKKEMTTEGISFYPPVTPGFSTTTDRSFSAGFSSGLTWPPSPLGDILTYSNASERRVWLRLSFSPLLKGFVNAQQGFGDEMKELLAKFKPKKALLACEVLFD